MTQLIYRGTCLKNYQCAIEKANLSGQGGSVFWFHHHGEFKTSFSVCPVMAFTYALAHAEKTESFPLIFALPYSSYMQNSQKGKEQGEVEITAPVKLADLVPVYGPNVDRLEEFIGTDKKEVNQTIKKCLNVLVWELTTEKAT